MRLAGIALIVSLAVSGLGPGAWGATLHAQAAQEAQTWRKVAEAIPLGTKVSVQTLDGRKVKGTLMRVDDTSMQIKKNTRLPEAPSSVTFEQIGNIERDHGGMGWGKAIGFGVGAGAAAMLTILAIAFQLD